MEYESKRNISLWSTCSPDIMLLIFKLLDYQTLLTCMSVCTMWRDLVDYMGQFNGLWQKFAEVGMYNKGITFKQKSILNWRDMYFNSQLWDSVTEASFTFHKSLEIQNVRNLHVYKDNIIVIFNSGIVKYYNVGTCWVTKELEQSYFDYQESDHIVVMVTSEQNFTVCLKHSKTSYPFTGYIFKLTDDRCYVLDKRYSLWLIKCCDEKNEKCLLARSYGNHGSICDINIYEDNVYILSSNGNIYLGDETSLQIKYVCNLRTTNFYKATVLAMFQKYSVVYRVCSDKTKLFGKLCLTAWR